MRKAGGRLFVDVTQQLASPISREMLLKGMGQHDPLLQDALMTLIERGDFIKAAPNDQPGQSSKGTSPVPAQPPIESDPTLVAELIKQSQTSIAALKQTIQTKAGSDLVAFIREDIQQLRQILFDPLGNEFACMAQKGM